MAASAENQRIRRAVPRGALFGALLSAALFSPSCKQGGTGARLDSPELTTLLQLVMPRKIEIQRHWTKPVSFAGTRAADGLEVILAAYDSLGDLTKIVGTVHCELFTWRPASPKRRGPRVGFWSVKLDSREALLRYWDGLAHFYRFPLQLPKKPLPPGRYILAVQLLSAGDEHLFDEYEFTYEEGTATPAATVP